MAAVDTRNSNRVTSMMVAYVTMLSLSRQIHNKEDLTFLGYFGTNRG